MTITGNIGSKFGTGCHTWSGNYKAGIWNAVPCRARDSPVHTGEDPFNLTLDPNAHGKVKTRSITMVKKSVTGTMVIRP
ncbi:MAG: hypothetical protein R3B37_17355 [Nitrospira sp.]|nr:hypothetical protein [Nitrospira sp.]